MTTQNAVDTKGPPFYKLRNLDLDNEQTHVDKLIAENRDKGLCLPFSCTPTTCLGSVIFTHPRKIHTFVRSRNDLLYHAKDFIDQYFASVKRTNSQAHATRWYNIQDEVNRTGTYQLTETELIYGCKLAWRNAARCIGRIQWSKLQVFDCRSVTTTSGMFEALCNHIKYGTNKGNIRSAITIFPQRTDGKHDFRVWNPELILYAGFRNEDGTITGDPGTVEITDVCIKLGWKPKRLRFEILPLVLSANGHDPDFFELPPDLVMQVDIVHPEFEWFKELELKWFVLPAVSGMIFDCGGLHFTACPFNGWYMSTEIGCRNFGDTFRYNMLETVANRMRLDTRTSVSLWKDKAMVELNSAVLYSFQLNNVTIVDHHTASESFMKHLENEQRLRNGCPADWVWIVPPMSGSSCPVFHQETANYQLYPAYDYQEPAWVTHVWKSSQYKPKKPTRKFHFKQIARAVKFTSKLFHNALSKRIKATILFATETGKSEAFAKKLGEIFSHAFYCQVLCMSDYDMSNIEHEALLFVVCSTFGNGDPPENGKTFAMNLHSLMMEHTGGTNNRSTPLNSASFIKTNSQSEITLERTDSFRSSVGETDTFGPLSNVRFAVFGLGSSAYPNYCAFGKYVDRLLEKLGGERLLRLHTGDEMLGQQQAFVEWAPEIFKAAGETFCLDQSDLADVIKTLNTPPITEFTVRFKETTADDLRSSYQKNLNRAIWKCTLSGRKSLHPIEFGKNTLWASVSYTYDEIKYDPGDHIAILPCNRTELVEGIINRTNMAGLDPDKPIELQQVKETHHSTGVTKSWEPFERTPRASYRTLLTRFLDITTPPTPTILKFLATSATNPEEQKQITKLATDSAAYEDWKYFKNPHLLEVFEEFPSISPLAPVLVAHLMPLQPRYYSISSSLRMHPKQIHMTVAVVQYRTQNKKGPLHYGVCSNYLNDMNIGDENVYIFVRNAPTFTLPEDPKRPVIMVGPGTGVAPFRGFWEDRYILSKEKERQRFGAMVLYYGTQTRAHNVYAEEKQHMHKEGILTEIRLALSREPGVPKTYVQHLMKIDSKMVYKMIVEEKGHFYVCGDITMAEQVLQTLKSIIQEEGKMTADAVETYFLTVRDEQRYHEDAFGIVLYVPKVHKKARKTARIRMDARTNFDTMRTYLVSRCEHRKCIANLEKQHESEWPLSQIPS